jgi:hypothetical protein
VRTTHAPWRAAHARPRAVGLLAVAAVVASAWLCAHAQEAGYCRIWPDGRVSLELDDVDVLAIARAVLGSLPIMASRTVAEIIREAEELLQTAKFGLEDMSRPERARSGMRNAVVFGRNTTWALQNLRGKEPDFDNWYGLKQKEMRADPLMNYFHNLRTQIEKQASTPTGSRGYIKKLSSDDMAQFYPAPPNATGFFIGDSSGGSGWEVVKSDGSIEKYYINLPSDIGQFSMMLPGAPGGGTLSAQELVADYLAKIELIVREARQQFIRSR